MTTDPQARASAPRDLGGVLVYCSASGCAHSALLPYTDAMRDRVRIGPITGWTSPPLRCPTCSTATTQLAADREVLGGG